VFETPEARWQREFAQLGAAAVRDSIARAGWDREKRAAARTWLESRDAHAWQAKRKPADIARIPWRQRLREAWWWLYVVGAIVILMVAGRLFRLL
jgi:hypothetical protein